MKELLDQLKKAGEKSDLIFASENASEQEKVDAHNEWGSIFHKACNMADTREKVEGLIKLTPPESIARLVCLDKLAEL